MGRVALAVLLFQLLLVHAAKESYGIVVDLGSKGSRVGIFVWPSDAKNPYAEVQFGGGKDPWYSKITPGVATFANDPDGAGPYLKPLLDYAHEKVPSSQRSTTPIYIRGTDNLRQILPQTTKAILRVLYDYTKDHYNFLMPENCMDLLSGLEEGGFLWMGVNYLLETFADKETPIGTLDMGSGSTQISFIPKSGTFIPQNYTFTFDYKKETYTTYTHSYSGFGYLSALYGINATLMKTTNSDEIVNPCLLHGYTATQRMGDRMITVRGGGSWAQCNDLTVKFLNLNARCELPPCRFNGAFQPPLHGKFIAVSNFADVVDILDLGDKATPEEIISEGIKFCALTWPEALEKYHDIDASELYTFCFGANYISNLLSKGYGFPLDKEISFDKKHDKAPFSWTLGAMAYELQQS